MHRLISEWITLEKELQEVGLDTETSNIQRNKDKILDKLGEQSKRNDQSSESLDFAQSTSQRILEAKGTMQNLIIAMESHDAKRKSEREEQKAEKKRRLEHPHQDPVDEAVDDIRATEERISALDNSLAAHAGDQRIALSDALDDFHASGPPMSNKQITTKAKMMKLREEIENAQKELNEVASKYALVIEGQGDVQKQIKMVQARNKELKQDFQEVL